MYGDDAAAAVVAHGTWDKDRVSRWVFAFDAAATAISTPSGEGDDSESTTGATTPSKESEGGGDTFALFTVFDTEATIRNKHRTSSVQCHDGGSVPTAAATGIGARCGVECERGLNWWVE